MNFKLAVFFVLVAGVILTGCEIGAASETDFGENVLSPGFFAELETAGGFTNPIPHLEAFYKKLNSPAEQAETELTIARIYNQSGGFVDYAKAIEWYDKALVREDLPLTGLAKQFILRGNSHETLKDPEDALLDYVRGMLICLHFNLPERMPAWPHSIKFKTQPPPDFSGVYTGNSQEYSDNMRNYHTTIKEQELVMERFYYVDAIQRILKEGKFKPEDVRSIAETLTDRKDRIDELLRRVNEPNPRPWK